MKRFLLSLVATLAVFSAGVFAQTGVHQEPAAPEKAEKPWTLNLNLDMPTQYFFRGYNVTDSGFILQPSAEFSYKVYESGQFSVTPFVGVWENITGNPRQTGEKPVGSPKQWSEGDLYGGVRLNYDKWEFTTLYTLYMYPNDSSPDAQEVGFQLKYDDSSWWTKTPFFASINPKVGLYLETQNDAATGESDYFEVGIEPTFKPFKVFNTPVTLSLPTTLGMSLDGYYTDSEGSNDTFGYWQTGIKASVPLTSLISEKYGKWVLTGEVDYINLMAESAKVSNGGEDDVFVAKIGIGVSF